jgi:hypothetical protein
MGFEITPTGLLNPPWLWDFAAMKIRAVIRWLLVLGIAAGVAIGPVAPLMAAMPSALTATTMAAAADEDAMLMADAMPCCPEQTKKAKDCDSCPFVALCMLTFSLPDPSGAGILIERYALKTAFAAIDDLLIDGLGAKPPDHPPRISV